MLQSDEAKPTPTAPGKVSGMVARMDMTEKRRRILVGVATAPTDMTQRQIAEAAGITYSGFRTGLSHIRGEYVANKAWTNDWDELMRIAKKNSTMNFPSPERTERIKVVVSRMDMNRRQRVVLTAIVMHTKGQSKESAARQAGLTGNSLRSSWYRLRLQYRKRKAFTGSYEEVSRVARRRKYLFR